MASFKDYYRTLYQTLGYPLTRRMALPSKVLSAAQKRLGVRIPDALRDYYLVAGRERRFGVCHNRLLPVSKWAVDKQRLIFMEENQGVVQWGVSTRSAGSPDPRVWQGTSDEPITWYPEHRKCSVFLGVMLHYQAICGGFRYCGSAEAPEHSDYRFKDHGWKEYGQVNSLLAFSRQNQVVCLGPPGDFSFMERWTVLAGGKTKADLAQIEADLGVRIV